ncbi:DUF423 domain-containing protein [soil metagenome]
MKTDGRFSLMAGAIIAGLGVAVGAFGAHALEAQVTPERLAVYETGARYQMYHALALLAVGLLQLHSASAALRWSARFFVAGVVLFSGSLYLLVLLDWSMLGAAAPFGGAAFLTGWTLLAYHCWHRVTPEKAP